MGRVAGFPPFTGEMSEGQRGIEGRQTPTIPVYMACAKGPLGEEGRGEEAGAEEWKR